MDCANQLEIVTENSARAHGYLAEAMSIQQLRRHGYRGSPALKIDETKE
jgi:hypothetical protein